MVKPWDETMKQLIDASPQQFVDWLVGTGTFLQFVPTELFQPLQQEEPLRADRCLALEIEGQPALLHLEVQSGPAPRIAERLLTSLAYGQRNRAEQAWLERVIQDMYDIIEQTPLYQSWTRRARQEGREEGLKEGLEKGLKEGKLEGMRQTLVIIVRVRFPRLVSLAKTRAAQIDDPKVFAVACFVSLLFPRPIWFYIIRYFATGNDPAKATAFNSRWQFPAFRSYIRIITVVWGIVYLVEFSVRVFMVYHLSIQQYLAIGPIVFYAVTFAVIAFTIAYARRMISRVTAMRQREEASTLMG